MLENELEELHEMQTATQASSFQSTRQDIVHAVSQATDRIPGLVVMKHKLFTAAHYFLLAIMWLVGASYLLFRHVRNYCPIWRKYAANKQSEGRQTQSTQATTADPCSRCGQHGIPSRSRSAQQTQKGRRPKG